MIWRLRAVRSRERPVGTKLSENAHGRARSCPGCHSMSPKMHHDEIDVDRALVRELLRRQFPHLSTMRLTRVPSTGTVNAIYRLGDDLCARLPRVL